LHERRKKAAQEKIRSDAIAFNVNDEYAVTLEYLNVRTNEV
jgi:hypothetical protein